MLSKDPQVRPSLAQVLALPLIKRHLTQFIDCKGQVHGEFPLKSTRFHLEVQREIITREQPCRDGGKGKTLTAREER